jgi:hypothetical protein
LRRELGGAPRLLLGHVSARAVVGAEENDRIGLRLGNLMEPAQRGACSAHLALCKAQRRIDRLRRSNQHEFAAGNRLTVVDEALAVEPTFGRRCVAEADVLFAGGERIEQRQGRGARQLDGKPVSCMNACCSA